MMSMTPRHPMEKELPHGKAPTATGAADMVDSAPAYTAKPCVSRAEQQYDWMVYNGLNYWVNLAVGLYLADSLRNGWAKPHLESSIQSLTHLLSSTNLVNAARADKIARPLLSTLAFVGGGWGVLAPMRWLENSKRENVHWVQKNVTHELQKDESGRELTAQQIYIDKEPPHQSWWNVIKRRIIVTVGVPIFGVALDRTIGEKNISDFIINNTNKALNSGHIPGGAALAKTSLFQRYLNLLALDTIYTYAGKTIMYYTNGTHGFMKGDKAEEAKEPPAIVMESLPLPAETAAREGKNPDDCKPCFLQKLDRAKPASRAEMIAQQKQTTPTGPTAAL